VLVNFGTSTVLVREIARHPERTTDLVRTALIMRLCLGAGIILLGAAVTYLLDDDRDVRLLIIISVAAGCVGQIGDVFASALRGREEFPKQNAAALAEKLLVSGASIALVFLHAPLWAFAAVYIAGGAVSGILCWRWLDALPAIRAGRAGDSTTGAAPGTDLRALAVAGMPFVAAMLFVSIYSDGSSALLIKKLSTDEALGCFGFAKRIVGAAHVVPVAIAGALLPVLSRLHAEGKNEEFARTVRRMVGGMVLCALPFAVLLIGAPQWILQLLHYPDGFVKALPVLRLSGGVMVLWFLQQAIGTALIACDQQVVFGRATGIAALLAFPVCGVCIWAGEHFFRDGAVGALVGDAILEAFLLTSYTLALPRGTLFPRATPGAASDTAPKVAA
ncbi:MAG: oligosaccharide flippase family protein, partial [Armatimonadetes bacterium]|nr:oligosaccharide flippase family protein [Armatimonadota bacterium]